MKAIEELGEVVKIEDKGERVMAFADWVSRWIEQGYIQSDFDEKLDNVTKGVPPGIRFEYDRNALEALLRQMLKSKEDWTEIAEAEDLGVVLAAGDDRKKFWAYRTRIVLTVIRAKPLEPQPVPPGVVLS
jgi:hypothetical protein